MSESSGPALILLTYLSHEITAACLESLSKSPPDSFTIFLVNNSPEDGSADLLRNALRATGLPHRYLESPENGGYSGGMNLGIQAALAEGFSHLVVMNNDTTVEPEFGSALRREIGLHPRAVLAARILDAATGRPSHSIGVITPRTLQVRHIFDPDYAGKVGFVSGCFMVLPAEVLKRTGAFREEYFMYAEDLELCMRFQKARVEILYRPGIIVRHKEGATTNKTGIPSEYYRMRNQTHAVLLHGSARQKIAYGAYIACLLAYKTRHPRVFAQFARGVLDALRGRLGRRG